MNNNYKTSFLGLTKEKLNEYIFPLLLAASVCFACLYTFNKPSAFILTAVFIIEEILLFRLFDRLKAKRSGAFVYALMLAVVLFLSFGLVVLNISAYGYYSPMRWFYAQNEDEVFQPDLTAALFLGGGFFLISIVYYFTRVRFRTMGIMLCTLFPFFIFSKRSDIMPDILTTLIVLLFLAVIIHNKRINKPAKKEKSSRLQIDRAYIICIAAFILITGALTMALEKPYYQSLLEKNARILNPFNMSIPGSGSYEDLSEQSSPRNAAPSYNYEPLFYLETNSAQEEIFLRTKAFTYFNGEVWENADGNSFAYYSKQAPEYSTDDIAADFSLVSGEAPDSLYTVLFARLTDEDFSPMYLPAPYGIITDDRPAGALKYYKLRGDTSVWRRADYYIYTPLDDSFEFLQSGSELLSLVRKYNFNCEEYLQYLSEKGDNTAAKRLADDYNKALDSYTDLSNISERLSELAKTVTADCHGDLEKAQRLESYFTENGFIYSLDYVPEDNSVDYFVFESKTGYCAGYATAMTLMARAVGLPARYVEGFAAFEKNDEGQFVIRDGYAHAFVEVYIPAAGWLTFDPTVSQYRNLPNTAQTANTIGILSKVFSLLNRISVVIIIAALVVLFALLDRIKELFLRILLHFKPIKERVIILYGNIIKTLGKSVNGDFSAYTPDMLRVYLLENRGAVPEKLISLFEKVAFGQYDCSKEEYYSAYKQYRQCCKYLYRASKKQ